MSAGMRSMRIMCALLALAFIAAPAAAQDASPLHLTQAEKGWLRDHPVFRTAGPLAFPPFHFILPDGGAGGMGADYIRLMGKRLGARIIMRTDPTWPEVLEGMRNRTLDVIACAARTAEREAYMNFSDPYLSFPMVIISRKDAPFMAGIQDLHGKRVAIIEGVSTLDWLKRDGVDFEAVFINSPLAALQAVSVGRADVYLGNLAASSHLIEKNGLVNLKIAAPTNYGNYDLHFAVRKDWPELIHILNKALGAVTREERNAIRQKWIAVRYEHGIDPAAVRRLALQIGSGVAGLILLIVAWNWQIRRARARFQGLIEHGSDIILALKPDQTIMYQSPSLTPLLGYGPGDLRGVPARELFDPSERESWGKVFDALLRGDSPQALEHWIRHKEGRYLYVASHCVNLLHEKALKCIVLNGRDVTERRRAEEALVLAKERAEAANQAKSAFLANMSHELRTPLNAILGASQVIWRHPDIPPEERENLDIIQRSGEHLLTLINQVLDLSKIEAGRMTLNLKSVDLHAMLEELEEMFSLRARRKGIALFVTRGDDLPRYVKIDAVKLRQVIINLLNNAVKFTQQGKVELRIRSEASSSSYILHFHVEDTGPGIAPEDKGKIFDAFGQADAGDHPQEGTGLGLPISRKFVQLMGGDLTARSEPGRGSTFEFAIRVAPAAGSDVLSKPPPFRVKGLAPGQEARRILIVDDKPDNRRVLFKLLDIGFEIFEAADGKAAVEMWRRHGPDLIWMDLRMPVMNGYEAVGEIRRLETRDKKQETGDKKRTVIIALSASSFEEEFSVAIDRGCDDFLRKPYREVNIFNLMEKHLGIKFILEEDPGKGKRETSGAAPSAEAAAGLPADLRADLLDAAERADYARSMAVIDQMRAHDPGLADQLAGLIADYRFDTLQKLFEPTIDGKKEDAHD